MSLRRIRRGKPAVTLLLLLPLLSGCPVPIPSGYVASSRENISREVAESLTVGGSSREDVLLLLGEADGAATDGSWLAYGSIYRKGGVAFVMAAGGSAGAVGTEKLEYSRLLITFDERGLVTGTAFVTRDCWEAIISVDASGAETLPCLDIAAPDGPQPAARDESR